MNRAAALWLLLTGCGPLRGSADETDGARESEGVTIGDDDGDRPDGSMTTTEAEGSETHTGVDTIGGPCTESADCDKRNVCDGLETCVDGTCVAGEPFDCDDEIACTIDTCDESTQGCTHEPDHFRCAAFEICDGNVGCRNDCVIAQCMGHVYQCGDCVDNDGDGLIDMQDPDCWGPCDNNEAGWKPEIPARAHS